MIQASDIVAMGLGKQYTMLSNQLHINHRKNQQAQALRWSSIPGVKVNPSFFEVTMKYIQHFLI